MRRARQADHGATGGNLVKVRFELPSDAWHGFGGESVWAEPVGEGRYRVRNVPFYVHGISLGDIITARQVEGEGLLFTGVLLRGGHSTYRIFLEENVNGETFAKYWDPLQVLGCTYERATKRLLAIDVPPNADIYVVYELLEVGERAGVWSFQEGHCGHPLRK
jgi:hypothetical protein